MQQKFPALARLLDFLTRNEPLVLLLCFQLLLRIPNLFEPYWYGDEAIYLTIGAGLRQGLRLYAETIDHKTPLIYYFAMVPTQFWFRMLTIFWTTISTILFFNIAQRLKFNSWQKYLATVLFILYTTLPWLEGNIPNGELFVMGFTLLGFYLFTFTNYFQSFIEETTTSFSKRDAKLLFFAGALFSLGTLTKVPGLFELVPVAMVGWFLLLRSWHPRELTNSIKSVLPAWIMLGVGFITPIFLSVIYYFLRGSLADYIDFGLLYNFRYAGNWGLPFKAPWLLWLFSLQGKLAVFVIVIVLISLSRKWLNPQTKLLVIWFWASLFASILSSRPYPHYIMQIVPAAALLVSWITMSRKPMIVNRIVGLMSLFTLVAVLQLLQFDYYRTLPYYHNFGLFITKQISQEEYFQRFDSLMSDNYRAAKVIAASEQVRFFIWGTNPTLYALTQKAQVGRFTVSFHIKDFPGAFEETMVALEAYQPEYVVVMNNEFHPFPEFYSFLDQSYLPVEQYQHFTLYKRTTLDLL